MRVLFRPDARQDVIEARDWYEKQSAGLGGEFVRALEAAVAAASRSPDAFPLVSGEFRRALLRRFPYSLVYQFQRDTLIVLACFHHRRDPRTLSDRIKP
jgi:plasmid stabilization system protein ParE